MNFARNLDRVQRFAKPRVGRLLSLLSAEVTDPRKARGKRHKLHGILRAVVSGLLANCASLRDVETLSQRLGLGRFGEGISDTAIGKVLQKLNPDELLPVLVQQVHDMKHRGELEPDGLPLRVATIDGKNLATLRHDAGQRGHKRINHETTECYWLMPALRSVLISAQGRPALGQWLQRPGHGENTEFAPFFEWLHQTYGQHGDIDVFDVDAGFATLANFRLVDERGYGIIMNLKDNQPELRKFAQQQLATKVHQSPLAWMGPEASNGIKIKRELWAHELPDGYLDWTGLRQLWLVRQTSANKDGEVVSVEDRYLITNLAPGRLQPQEMLTLVRRHWAIENDCFKSLDVQWKEDRKPWWTEGSAVPVLAVLRLMAYNLSQLLRKRHLNRRVARRDNPTPWRELFDLLKDVLLELARLETARAAPPGPS